MTQDQRMQLVDDIISGLTDGTAARAATAFSVEKMDDGTVLQVDLGDPDMVYLVTVSSQERLD